MFTHRKQLPLKPATQLAVDYSHWLAPYLSCCYMQNELGPTAKMVDLTLHANHGASTGTTMQIGSYGRERVFASGNLVAVPYGPQLDSVTIWPGAHIRATIILARVKSTGGATNNQVICCRKYDSVANIPYFLGIGGINAASGVGHYTGGFSSTGITTDIRADNTYHVVCGVLVDTPGLGAYAGFYYVDGVRDKYSLLGSFPNPKTLALNVGADYNNTNSFIGSIESLQVFVGVPIPDIGSSSPAPANHAMFLDGLIADLSRNPYQLLTASRLTTGFLPASNITLALTGNSSTSHVGSLGVNNSQIISGNQSVSVIGSIAQQRTLSVVGNQASGVAGTLFYGVTKAIFGNQSSSSIGSISQQRTLPVTGNTASGIAGALSFGLTKAISGNAANGGIGSVSFGLSKALSGLQSNSSIGSVSYGVAKALTGNASVTGLGALSYALRLSTTGVHATGYAGTVTAPSGNITLAITGVHAVLSAGSISPSVAVNITGTEAVGGVGTLSHEMSLKLSGVETSGKAGAVFAPFGIFSAKTQDAEATNCLSNDHELTNGSVQDGKITSITIEVEP